MTEEPIAEIDYDYIKNFSDGAVLFEADDETFWVPNSVLVEIDEEDKTVHIKQWWAEKEGLV